MRLRMTSLVPKQRIPPKRFCSWCKHLYPLGRTICIRGMYGEPLYHLCFRCGLKGVWIDMPQALKKDRWETGKFSQERIKLNVPYEKDIEVID